MKKDWKDRFFVAYAGDEIIASGTVFEIAETLNISVSSCKWLTYPSVLKRDEEVYKKTKGYRTVLIEG